MQQRGTRARAQQATPFAETASRAGRNPRPRTTKTARKIISNRVGRPLNVQTTSGRPQSSRFPSQATVGAEPDGNLKYLGWPSLPARSESSSPNRYPSPKVSFARHLLPFSQSCLEKPQNSSTDWCFLQRKKGGDSSTEVVSPRAQAVQGSEERPADATGHVPSQAARV